MRFFTLVTFFAFTASAWAQVCKNLGKGVIDEGCSDAFPTCVYKNGGQVVGSNTGHHCALCINSKQPNDKTQVAPDEGCDDALRVCIGSKGLNNLAADTEGTSCGFCSNSQLHEIDPTDIDDGCPPEQPICLKASGETPANYAVGDCCVAKCVNSKVQGQDKACPPKFPNCVLEDGSVPGLGVAGSKCAGCTAATCDDNDPCTDDICDPVNGCIHVENSLCGCKDWQCGDASIPCFVNNAEGVCMPDVHGNEACVQSFDNCNERQLCDDNSQCGEGEACVIGCCDCGVCVSTCF